MADGWTKINTERAMWNGRKDPAQRYSTGIELARLHLGSVTQENEEHHDCRSSTKGIVK